MGFAPSGRVVRKMRFAWEDDGVMLRKAGHGIIVYLKQDSESRRTFWRFIRRNAMEASAIRGAQATCPDGTYNRRTGEERIEAEVIPYTFNVIGSVPALRELANHPMVESWEFAVSVRVPYAASGDGTEKPRPSSGTVFGKPATVAATGAKLQSQQQESIRATLLKWHKKAR